MNPAIDCHFRFSARVRLQKGKMFVTRPVVVHAADVAEAKARMLAIFYSAWPGWEVSFVMQPMRVKS